MSKKLKSFGLVIALLLSFVTYSITTKHCVAVNAAAVSDSDMVMPLYNNTSDASFTFTISSSGWANLALHCRGYSGTTSKITATSYIELQIGSSWIRLSNGQTNSQWVDTVNGYILLNSHGMQLTSKGTYRGVVVYNVDGSGGATDVIGISRIETYSKS